MIPKILHRVVPEDVPARFDDYWHEWCALHPDWQHLTWQDPLDADDFELGRLFARCTAGAQLAGLVRLEVVWRLGGVYVDMDVEPVRPVDDLLGHACFFGTEGNGVLTDAVFGASQHHPGIRACMDRLLGGFWSPNPSDTGPLLTTEVLAGRNDVTVLDQEAFYPYLWHEDQTPPKPGTYAIHRWNHSWKDWQS